MMAQMNAGRILTIAGIDGALAVGLGAFGAHGLRERLEAAGAVDLWRTAAHYQFVHVLALLGLAALVTSRGPSRVASATVWLWTVGTVLFAGSLYALALGAPRAVGAITPLGGLAFMAGWLALCLLARRSDSNSAAERN